MGDLHSQGFTLISHGDAAPIMEAYYHLYDIDQDVAHIIMQQYQFVTDIEG
jgi:hypothetical protein